jgi:hypothetical protein
LSKRDVDGHNAWSDQRLQLQTLAHTGVPNRQLTVIYCRGEVVLYLYPAAKAWAGKLDPGQLLRCFVATLAMGLKQRRGCINRC